MTCDRCISLPLPVDCQEIKFPASEMTSLNKKKTKVSFQSRTEFAKNPNFYSTSNRRAAPSVMTKTKVLVWMKGTIAILFEDQLCNCVIETLELLFTSLSDLLCRRDRSVSFTSSFDVFVIQSFALLRCCAKIRALLGWTFLVLTFFRCSHVGVIFQCKCVILLNLFFGPSSV